MTQKIVTIAVPLTQYRAALVLLPQYTKRIQVQCRDATAILMAHRLDAVDTQYATDYFTIKASTIYGEDVDVGDSKGVGIYLSCASASKVAEITCVVEEV